MHYVKLNPCEGVGCMVLWVLLFSFLIREILLVYRPNMIMNHQMVDEKWLLIYSVVLAVILTLAVSAINSRM